MFFNSIRLLVLPFLVVLLIKESCGLIASQVTITNKRGNFQTAQAACQAQGMKVIRIENSADNDLVWGLTSAMNVGRFWIDGNNIAGGPWINSDSRQLSYYNWARGEPNNWWGVEHCIEVGYYLNQFWNDMNCATDLGIVCQNNEVDTSAGGDPSKFELVPQTVRLNYADAVNHCKNLNMELVKIDSDWMNRYVYNFALKNNLIWYWMDANDIANEGQWVTSDGAPVPFKNWAPGEPNGWRVENCVHGLFYRDAQWNDISCYALNAVICLRLTNKPAV